MPRPRKRAGKKTRKAGDQATRTAAAPPGESSLLGWRGSCARGPIRCWASRAPPPTCRWAQRVPCWSSPSDAGHSRGPAPYCAECAKPPA